MFSCSVSMLRLTQEMSMAVKLKSCPATKLEWRLTTGVRHSFAWQASLTGLCFRQAHLQLSAIYRSRCMVERITGLLGRHCGEGFAGNGVGMLGQGLA